MEAFITDKESLPTDQAMAVDSEETDKAKKGIKKEPPTSFVAAIEPIPLLLTSPAPPEDFLCMENDSDEDEETSMSNEPALMEFTTNKIQDKVQEGAPAEKSRSFKPLIEVITSEEVVEGIQNNDVRQKAHLQEEASPPGEELEIEKGKGMKSVRFSHCNTIHVIESSNSSELDDQGIGTQWAVPTSKSNPQAAFGDSLVIEDITDVPDKTALVHEPSPSEDAAIEDPFQDFKLSEVPLVSEETIQRVDAAMAELKAKPVESLSAEEKVWQLAASGGSTLDEDAVSLDPQTKARVKERLQKANVLDCVSLKF